MNSLGINFRSTNTANCVSAFASFEGGRLGSADTHQLTVYKSVTPAGLLDYQVEQNFK